ncbi:hypothetical protein BH23BAC3_BH23BAC3_24640 [soil metagenome]
MKTKGNVIRRAAYSLDYRISNSVIDYRIKVDPAFGVIDNPSEIIRVPVERITHQCISDEVKDLRRCKSLLFHQTIYRDGNIAGGNWDLQKKLYDKNKYLVILKERFVEKKEWENTLYYQVFHTTKDKGRKYRNRKSWEEFKRTYLNSCDKLFHDIKENGYKSNYEITGNPQKEVIVCISRSGEIMRPPMGGGNHRFAIAKILGLKEIPVVVSVWHKMYIDGLKKHPTIREITPKTTIQPILEGKIPFTGG